MSPTKCRDKYVAIIMSRTKMSHNNNIAQQKCRAHNVAAYQSIDFLPASNCLDIKQVRMLCVNGDCPPLPGTATPRVRHSHGQPLPGAATPCMNRIWSDERNAVLM